MNLEGGSALDVRRFEPPAVEGSVVSEGGGIAPTAGELDRVHTQAREEGYEIGHAAGRIDGLAAAKTEIEELQRSLRQAIQALATPLAELDDEIVETLGQLGLVIAKHLVRRELKTAPGEVVNVARECLKALPPNQGVTVIRVHPTDVQFIEQAMDLNRSERVQIEGDPALARGDCCVETDTSRIDASLESRLGAIAAQMLGGDREEDGITAP
ncbi:MAG: flagellar assembly protein FliH [Pseudomonadota bacterium]